MSGSTLPLPPWARYMVRITILTAAYVATAKLGLRLAFANENVTMVWPPVGIATAALVLWGRGVSPAVWAGALIANLLNGAPLGLAFGISVGNTLAPLAGATLLERLRFRPTLERPTDVFALVFGAGFGATLVSATGGIAALAAFHAITSQGPWTTWIQWWVGDAMGVVLVAPLILTLARVRSAPSFRLSREAVGLVLAVATVTSLVMMGHVSLSYLAPLSFLLLPGVAVRFRQPGAAIATFVMTGMAILKTVSDPSGTQPFPVTTRLLILQTFNASIAVTVLTLAAVMTQRLRAESELQAMTGQLRERIEERTTMLQASQRLAHIGSFRWDSSTNTTTWTDELFSIYGMPPAALAPTRQDYLKKVHPDHRELIDTATLNAIKTREPFELEYKILRPSGDDRWVHSHVEAVADPAGGLLGLEGTCQDITERKLAEQATRVNEERFRTLVLEAPYASLVVDDAGKILMANEELCSMFGYTSDELVGSDVDILVPQEKRHLHADHRTGYASDARRRAMGSGLELWGLRKDGSQLPIDITLSPIPSDRGMDTIAAVRDVSEQRNAEEVLRKAYERERAAAENLRALDQTKMVFLEAVSHELRTPLTVIIGVSALLQTGDISMDDEERVSPLVQTLASSAKRLQTLLDDLLDLDRLGRGIIEPHRHPTPVADLIARTVGALDITDRTIHIDPHEVVANIDPAQTERIVENLVINAIRHTLPHTEVWARAEPADDGVVIVVEDAGKGVSSYIKDGLFEPFVKETQGHVAGTGIGLSLVDRFAKLHGGRAWVEDRPGGGASFRVYLPSTKTNRPNEAA